MSANFYLLTTKDNIMCNICQHMIKDYQFIGIVTGEDDLVNPTIRMCKQCCNELHELSEYIPLLNEEVKENENNKDPYHIYNPRDYVRS